jgi:hypothetical protein
MATSAVALGKIEIAIRKKQNVPKGWIIDKNGADTTNPKDMPDGGAQLPLGSMRDMGGHKGYCLGVMVDMLSCVLSGANWGPFAPPFALRQYVPERSVGKGIGHFFGALQIDGFIDKDEFKKQVDEWIRVFRNTKPVFGTNGPLIPGDPEREAEATRSKKDRNPVRSESSRDLTRFGYWAGTSRQANVWSDGWRQLCPQLALSWRRVTARLPPQLGPKRSCRPEPSLRLYPLAVFHKKPSGQLSYAPAGIKKAMQPQASGSD